MYLFVLFLSLLVLLICGKSNSKYKTFNILFVLLIFFLGIFRDTCIGTDIMLRDGGGYYFLWKSPFSIAQTDTEKGFLYLSNFIKSVYESYYFYYGAIFFLNILFYILAAKKIGIKPSIFLSIIFITSALIPSFNTIRQYLGLSFVIYFFMLLSYDEFNLVDKKAKYYKLILFEILVVLTAVFFHKSLLIVALVPIFQIKGVQNFLSKDAVLWGLLFTSLLIITVFSHFIQPFISWLIYASNIGGRANLYADALINHGHLYESSHGILGTIMSGSLAILISKKRRNSLFYIGFIGLLLTNIAAVNLRTLGRLFCNLEFFIYFYYAQNWFCFYNSKTFLGLNRLFILKGLILLIWLSSFYFTTLLNSSVSPYKTYLFL